jgi:hypothetical protein
LVGEAINHAAFFPMNSFLAAVAERILAAAALRDFDPPDVSSGS